MHSAVFWCLLVLFLVFWLYCITTVTPFKRRSQGWSFLSGCRVLDQSQQKCRFLAEIQIHCKVFQLQPKRETSFSSLGDNEAFCAKRETRGGENSTPNIVGPTMLGVVICARVGSLVGGVFHELSSRACKRPATREINPVNTKLLYNLRVRKAIVGRFLS